MSYYLARILPLASFKCFPTLASQRSRLSSPSDLLKRQPALSYYCLSTLRNDTQQGSVTGSLMPPGKDHRCKRLIVACDGTWMNSDNGFERDSYLPFSTNGHLQTPTNVTRICRAILPEGENGIQQIVYYQAGVGTGNNLWDHLVGGGTGAGLSEHIREGYGFLANNYQAGDEIFLIGFSRGAFTARSIAGLIASIGLLTKRGLTVFYEIFKDWENQITPNYVTKFPDVPFPNRPPVTEPAYAQELERLGFSTLNIPIKAIGVWDTVGSLGIPNTGLWPEKPGEYSFVDTKVSENVEYAYHALALDEQRRPFAPTIWEKPAGQKLPKILKQCWFPGVHSNVGGSYDDTQLADITLAWMISQLDALLYFDKAYITWQHDLNLQYYKQKHVAVRPWSLGTIYNSRKGLQFLAGQKLREPGRYHFTDPRTGKPTSKPLENTNEHIHACVRVRMGLGGLGMADSGPYDSEALQGWSLVSVNTNSDETNGAGDPQRLGQTNFKWEYGGDAKQGPMITLPEDELGDVELKLLGMYPEVYKHIWNIAPKAHR